MPRGASSASATPGGGWRPATRRLSWRGTGTRFSTRWPTTSTRRARWRRWRTGSATRTAPAARSATVTCARCWECWGWRTCSRPARGRRPRWSSWPSAAPPPAPAATSPRPTGCATSCARAAGRCATARTAPISCRSGRETRGCAGSARRCRARLAGRAGRAGRVIVYGRNAVREAIRGPREVRAVWATKGAAREFEGARVARADEIARRAGSTEHQGVCADVEEYRYADAAELLRAPDPVLVALDEVTDPQNLGAVCRTAECSGATGVILPERRSATVTPAVCKASAGAVEHLAIARVRNLADFLAEAKAAGCWSYGAAAGGRTGYRAVDWRGGVVLVLGAEGRGVRPRVASACDDVVAIPLRGRIDSLNVSATAAVLLYEILRQRLDAST